MRRLRKGDLVVVTSGNSQGKQGRVTRVLTDTGRVVVEGVNLVKRHVKATPQSPGGILEVEAPLAESNVMLVDPESGKPTRVRFEVRDGNKVRVAKSGAVIEVQR